VIATEERVPGWSDLNVPCPIRRGVPHGCTSRVFAASVAFALISGARLSLFPTRRQGL